MQIIRNITSREAEEVEEIIEQIYAYSNLRDLLSDDEERQETYQKCLKSCQNADQAYEKWWERMREKYSLQEYPKAELKVDFVEEIIFI